MKQIPTIYNNIIYIYNSSIILKDKNNFYENKFKKSTLNEGIIINKEDFINNYMNFLKKKHLSRFLWNKRINIIYNANYSVNDKKILKSIFYELGYKEVSVTPEESLLKLNKNDAYLINGKELKLYYIDEFNQKHRLILDNNFTEEEIKYLIKNRCQKRNLFIINNDKKIISLIDSLNIKYYYYAISDNFFLKNSNI